jgi:hypothetical protein
MVCSTSQDRPYGWRVGARWVPIRDADARSQSLPGLKVEALVSLGLVHPTACWHRDSAAGDSRAGQLPLLNLRLGPADGG